MHKEIWKILGKISILMHRSHFDTNKFKSYTKHILKFRIDDGDVQVKLNKKV